MASEMHPGAPTVESAGPALPAEMKTAMPHSRTAAAKVSATRPEVAEWNGSPYERLMRSQP